MNNIELIQGDSSPIYKFKREDKDGNVIKSLPKKMWITFKKNCNCDYALFQKKLEDNSITYSEEDNYYRFKISSEDTCKLKPDTYGFDIAIINENGDKKTLLNDGELIIKSHYTKKCNEV